MDLIGIPAFRDNYIWLLNDRNRQCVIIDPGESGRVLSLLEQRHIAPAAILLTHHHQDHLAGVAGIIARYPALPVYGPQETASKGAAILMKGGDNITINNRTFTTIATPGHTSGHIAWYSPPWLFCGDTLFSAGCGRIFEGNAEQMYASVQKLAQLPDDTLICCAHEYTLKNIQFARWLLPEDPNLKIWQQHIIALRAKNQPSVPTTLGLERIINPFLRCDDTELQNKLQIPFPAKTLVSVFAQLRARKDCF